MMNRDGLLVLCNYNTYATALVLDALDPLTDTDLHRKSSPSHDSVYELLMHMLAGEAYFLSACQGHPLEELPDLPSLGDMQRYWDNLARETRQYLTSLHDDDLAQEIPLRINGRDLHFPIWQALTQAFVHSTHHRGELSIVLTKLGHPLPTLDFILQFIAPDRQG